MEPSGICTWWMSSGWCCKRKHILPMQERHRPVAVGNARSRLSCYGTARNQDRNPMQANHYLCNDTYMCCTSPRRCLLWPTQIGRWDYLIDQLLSLGWSTTILYEIRVDGYNSRRGQVQTSDNGIQEANYQPVLKLYCSRWLSSSEN